jgi:hypothetical protein
MQMKPTIPADASSRSQGFPCRPNRGASCARRRASLRPRKARDVFYGEREAVEDPAKLHEEFEAHYDSDEYESKIARLLHHAHAREKKESPEKTRLWSDAIRTLNKGDHYLLVLWSLRSTTERPPYDSLKLLGVAILIVLTLLAWQFWVAPRISGIDWLSSAVHAFWKVVQASRIIVFCAAAALGLSALLARFFFWRDHGRNRKAQNN